MFYCGFLEKKIFLPHPLKIFPSPGKSLPDGFDSLKTNIIFEEALSVRKLDFKIEPP
jgi:hypothetical protein